VDRRGEAARVKRWVWALLLLSEVAGAGPPPILYRNPVRTEAGEFVLETSLPDPDSRQRIAHARRSGRAHPSVEEILERVEYLPVAKIVESKSNPRKTFGDMTEMIESVRAKGVLVPVLCRPAENGWELVFGARRLRAAQAAGRLEIPAMVRTMTDREVLEVQVIENLQRADVHLLEVRRGLSQCNLTISRRHGASRHSRGLKLNDALRQTYLSVLNRRMKPSRLTPASPVSR
jgi:ParB/RepB/Spo0J family partition protein